MWLSSVRFKYKLGYTLCNRLLRMKGIDVAQPIWLRINHGPVIKLSLKILQSMHDQPYGIAQWSLRFLSRRKVMLPWPKPFHQQCNMASLSTANDLGGQAKYKKYVLIVIYTWSRFHAIFVQISTFWECPDQIWPWPLVTSWQPLRISSEVRTTSKRKNWNKNRMKLQLK